MTHRGPFQPIPLCDSVAGRREDKPQAFADVYHLGVFARVLSLKEGAQRDWVSQRCALWLGCVSAVCECLVEELCEQGGATALCQVRCLCPCCLFPYFKK